MYHNAGWLRLSRSAIQVHPQECIDPWLVYYMQIGNVSHYTAVSSPKLGVNTHITAVEWWQLAQVEQLSYL